MGCDEEENCSICGEAHNTFLMRGGMCRICWTKTAEEAEANCSPPIIGGMAVFSISPETYAEILAMEPHPVSESPFHKSEEEKQAFFEKIRRNRNGKDNMST